MASFTSRGIRDAGNVKPDVAAVGVSVFSAGMGTGDDGLNDSGTSMATPEVAGLDALVRNVNSGWTPEEVKADIMNTAGQDLFTGQNHSGKTFAPGRVGAGRIDAKAALDNQVLAFVTDDPGAVSASFGTIAATGPMTLHKTIELENTSGSDETYNTSYDPLTAVPGANYSVSPSQVDGRRGRHGDRDAHADDRSDSAHEDDRPDGRPDPGRERPRLCRRRERPRAVQAGATGACRSFGCRCTRRHGRPRS